MMRKRSLAVMASERPRGFPSPLLATITELLGDRRRNAFSWRTTQTLAKGLSTCITCAWLKPLKSCATRLTCTDVRLSHVKRALSTTVYRCSMFSLSCHIVFIKPCFGSEDFSCPPCFLFMPACPSPMRGTGQQGYEAPLRVVSAGLAFLTFSLLDNLPSSLFLHALLCRYLSLSFFYTPSPSISVSVCLAAPVSLVCYVSVAIRVRSTTACRF